MFKLTKLSNEKFRIINDVQNVRRECGHVEMVNTMKFLDVSASELKAALDDMTEKNHDTADFGVSFLGRSGFIYSHNAPKAH